MENYEIGIRKFVKANNVKYWHSITALATLQKSLRKRRRNESFDEVSSVQTPTFTPTFIDSTFWKLLISFSILVNIYITIVAITHDSDYFYPAATIAISTSVVYWIDFFASLTLKMKGGLEIHAQARRTSTLLVEGLSIIPVSEIYIYKTENPNQQLFWFLRLITFVRFYRIPYYLYIKAIPGRYFWKVFLSSTILYLSYLIFAYCGIFIVWNSFFPESEKVQDATYMKGIHLTVDTILNIGFGDITFTDNPRIWMSTIGMAVGFTVVRGLLTGVLATQFANKEKALAIYKHEFEATKRSLKEGKADKKSVRKIVENMKAMWKFRKGELSFSHPVQILPISMQKELFFDINFGVLNRSVAFTLQPKSFLRSVSVLMKNMTFFPGDVISEPVGVCNFMICIVSGVVEVLIGESETSLISLAAGSVIGESSLFMGMPKTTWLKASTYVEAQVLMREDFSRLSLTYPKVCQGIRADIMFRLTLPEKEPETKGIDRFRENYEKYKTGRGFIEQVREYKRLQGTGFEKIHKSALLSLYVVSENIPKVKTLPINLVRGNPLILRPNTHLTELWEIFHTIVIIIVVFVYPFMAGFVRKVSEGTTMMMLAVEIVYIVDLYMQSTTAILRRDNFTFYTDFRAIIAHRLKSPGFYLDVIATFDFTVYADLTSIKNKDYAILLLSLNRILKFWHIFPFFKKLENNLNLNLLAVRFFKFITYFAMVVVWAAVALYLEACPEEVCIKERWFATKEQEEIKNGNSEPLTQYPAIMSLYWSCVMVAGVGYGDITGNTDEDFFVMTVWTIAGCILLTVIMAEASATMKSLTRIRSQYQEEVFTVDKFMSEHRISKDLQRRVRIFFQVQWNYDKGHTLTEPITKKHFVHGRKHILVTDLMKDLLTVPLFRGSSIEFLKLLTEMCKVRIIPPNEVIVEKGSVIRELYILRQGYCYISDQDDPKPETSKILHAVNSFGFVEMLQGSPVKLNVKSLTHCKVVTLSYASYLRAVTVFPTTKIRIDEKLAKDYSEKNLTFYQLIGLKTLLPPNAEEELLWRLKQIFSDAIINVYGYHKIIGTSYWEPFNSWGKFRVFSYLLLPVVLTPKSYLIKIWMFLRVLRVLIMGLIGPIVLSLPNYLNKYYNVILALQIGGWVDMYLMFHVSYYDETGLLMFHPSKTAISYLRGNFVIDFVTEFPIYVIIRTLQPWEEENDVSQFIGLLAVLQFYKFFQACSYLEKDILRRSEVTKTLKFIPLALLVTNIVTALHIIVECFSFNPTHVIHTYEKKIAREFQHSIHDYCFKRTMERNATMSIIKMYITGFYWVTSTMTTCGFGDLSAHSRVTMILSMFTIVLGVFLYGYLFANLTSNMISQYTIVTKYRRRIIEMAKFVANTNAHYDVLTRLKLHYEYNWKRTEGTKPQKMLLHLHSTLRGSLMASMYEETVKLVQSFEVASKSILRIIGKYLDDLYFLRGETVVKYKDILEYIYVIHRGTAEVTDEAGNPIAIMGKGGMFGNLSNKSNALSTINVVARNNLELLKLDSNKFFRALQFGSDSADLAVYLSSLQTDYLKPLNSTDENLENYSQTDITGTLGYRVMAPMKKDSARGDSIFRVKWKIFIFKLTNSIYKPPNQTLTKGVILPDTLIAQIITYISSFLALYVFLFQDFTLALFLITYFLDVVFYFKMPLSFILSYYDKYGDYVISKEKIKKRYLESKHFKYDLAANLPIEVFAFAVPSSWALNAYSLLHLNRTLRLYHVNHFFKSKSTVLMSNKIHLQLWWVVVCLSIMVHVTAGVWYFQACPFDRCQKNTWVIDRKLHIADKFTVYTNSVYFSVGIFTATSFGDIGAITAASMITAIVLMIFSQFCMVLLAGSMATVVYDQILNIVWYEGIVSSINTNFHRLGLSKFQTTKIWLYVSSYWHYKRHIPKFIKTAPYAMRCEVMYAMYGSHLSQSYLFCTMEEAFLRQLAVCFDLVIFFEGNYIVQQGDIDSTMYFIIKGQVSVLTIHGNLLETIHFVLEENDQFGTSQGLQLQKPHDFSYRAETTVEVLALKYNEWKHLLKYFPKSEAEINSRIRELPHKMGEKEEEF